MVRGALCACQVIHAAEGAALFRPTRYDLITRYSERRVRRAHRFGQRCRASRRMIEGGNGARGAPYACLIHDHRIEKSASSCGSVQMQCKWSGNRTHASISNGAVRRVRRIASRNASRTGASVKTGKRRSVFTVKKYVPPATFARR